jgi:hypothetical protein
LWAAFQHDPRDPAVAPLRASDADRDVVQGLLAEAFADGRLDREEYDERTGATLRARTLGELPPLVTDLVPDRPLLPAKVPLAAMSPDDLQRRAAAKWREERREAVGAFLFLSVVTWTIWISLYVTGHGHFPWPAIVSAVTGMNALRVLAGKREIMESELSKLQRRQAKELRAREKKRESGP